MIPNTLRYRLDGHRADPRGARAPVAARPCLGHASAIVWTLLLAIALAAWTPRAEAQVIPRQIVTVGDTFFLDVSVFFFAQPGSDPLNFSTVPLLLPGGLSINSTTGVISGIPTNAGAGTHTITVHAEPLIGVPLQPLEFMLIINSPPELDSDITPNPDTATTGEAYELLAGGFFSDPDGDSLTFTANGLPPSLSINASTGVIFGTPTDAEDGAYTITVTASDGHEQVSDQYTLNVERANRPPELDSVITPRSQNITVGRAYNFDAGRFFSDPDDDTLEFSAEGLPADLLINSSTGVISGTPTNDGAGRHTITVTASDGSESASGQYTLNVNRPPEFDDPITPSPQEAPSGEAYSFNAGAFFSDPDDDSLTFTANGLPSSLSISSSTGVISGTPTDAEDGPYTITVTASDGSESASGQYTLNVSDLPPVLPDPPPVLSTPEDTPIEITPARLNAIDANPGALTVILTAPDDDANFTIASNGRTVVPAEDFNGTLQVEVRVRDASQQTSNAVMVTINVTPVNDAPRIDSVPEQRGSEGIAFELALGDFVTDPEGDTLTFSATGLPPGLTIDTASGMIAGAPAIDAAAGVHSVGFTAHDGSDSASGAFTMRITAAGRADLSVSADVAPNPALAGSPATFSFTVTNASDTDVGNASLEIDFDADSPFTIESVDDSACSIEPGSNAVVVRCAIAPLIGNASRTIAATSRAQQAAEIRAVANVAITDVVPIDEMDDNDSASVTLIVASSLAGPAQQLNVPGARALAVGDFDGDGIEDLAVAAGAGEPLRVFLNRATADNEARLAFDPTPIAVSEPMNAVDLAAADLDGDGTVDLVVADADGAHSVLLNTGAGTFTASPLTGGPQSTAVAIADLDGDGLPDIAFAGRGDGANVVFLNTGGGQFAAVGAVLDGAGTDVIAADILAGGPPELVFSRDGGHAAVVSLTGGSAQAFELSTGPATSLAAGDLNGDEQDDLVLGRLSPDAAGDEVRLNTSTGVPSFFLAATLSRAPTATVLTGDFDEDGRLDVVVIAATGGHRIFRNSSAANLAFVLNAEQFSTTNARAAATGQLNGDGRLDVAVAETDGIAIFLNDGRGNLGRGDVTAPRLTLIGEPTVTVTISESYVDAGATASDDVDGDLSERIVVDNPVNVDVIGRYTVSYNVTDLSGNPAQTLTRTVEIRAREAGGGGGGGAIGLVGLLSLLAALGGHTALRHRTHLQNRE